MGPRGVLLDASSPLWGDDCGVLQHPGSSMEHSLKTSGSGPCMRAWSQKTWVQNLGSGLCDCWPVT